MDNTDFINAINAAKAGRAMSSEIEASLSRFKELTMFFDLEFVSSTKTFGSQGGSEYNEGYGVICSVKDEGMEFQVLFGVDSNEMVESLNSGDKLKEKLRFISYDPLYQRPIMGQVFSELSPEDNAENDGGGIYPPSISDESDSMATSEQDNSLSSSISEGRQSIANSLGDENNEEGSLPSSEGAWGGADPDPDPASAAPVSIPQPSDSSASAGKGKLFTCGLIAVALLVGAFILVFTFSSGGRSNIDVEWIRDSDREFTATYTVNGVRVIEAKLIYLGKSPDLPFQGNGPNYDWRTRNTDFYTSSMKNLTSYPIKMKSISYKLKKGKFSGTNPQYESYLKAYWTSTVILPSQTVTRKNNWVWGKAQTNTLTKTYSLQIELGEDKAADPADPFFSAENQDSLEFEVQFPLKFIR